MRCGWRTFNASLGSSWYQPLIGAEHLAGGQIEAGGSAHPGTKRYTGEAFHGIIDKEEPGG